MRKPLVSVIMPAYNSEMYISEAIDSVLSQEYENIELLIINDGSIDTTQEIVLNFSDNRIIYLEQSNNGVSSARNLALDNMKGDFFCFLDSDDLMPFDSISSRLKAFSKHPDAIFIGGGQQVFKEVITKPIRIQKPTFTGIPTRAMALLDSRCFINCGTWLIRRVDSELTPFPVGWTHLEDAYFFLKNGHLGKHYSISNTVQYYRVSDDSAMNDYEGLAEGYLKYFKESKNHLSFSGIIFLKLKILKIMTLTFCRRGELTVMLKWIFYYMLA